MANREDMKKGIQNEENEKEEEEMENNENENMEKEPEGKVVQLPTTQKTGVWKDLTTGMKIGVGLVFTGIGVGLGFLIKGLLGGGKDEPAEAIPAEGTVSEEPAE